MMAREGWRTQLEAPWMVWTCWEGFPPGETMGSSLRRQSWSDMYAARGGLGGKGLPLLHKRVRACDAEPCIGDADRGEDDEGGEGRREHHAAGGLEEGMSTR